MSDSRNDTDAKETWVLSPWPPKSLDDAILHVRALQKRSVVQWHEIQDLKLRLARQAASLDRVRDVLFAINSLRGPFRDQFIMTTAWADLCDAVEVDL